MRKIKIVSVILSAAFVIPALPVRADASEDTVSIAAPRYEIRYDTDADSVSEDTESFVWRLYSIFLDREPDDTGRKYWVDKLNSHTTTGTYTAFGFMFSTEFQSKDLSNPDLVEIMYNAFFGRQSDHFGKEYWVDKLDSGMSREELFAGFANSKEFFSLCKEYGIVAGAHIPGFDREQIAKVNLFVNRLYEVLLGRECDQGGMEDWTKKLLKKEIDGASVAYGFAFSDEYRKKSRNDEEILEDWYRAFFNRAGDQSGMNTWRSLMNTRRVTDLDVFNGFVMSTEFDNLCKNYGINRGNKIENGALWAREDRLLPNNLMDPDYPYAIEVKVDPKDIVRSFSNGTEEVYYAKETSASIRSSSFRKAVKTVSWLGYNSSTDDGMTAYTDTNMITFYATCEGKFNQPLYFAYYYTDSLTDTGNARKVNSGTMDPLPGPGENVVNWKNTRYQAIHGLVDKNLKPGTYILVVSDSKITDGLLKDYESGGKGCIITARCLVK